MKKFTIISLAFGILFLGFVVNGSAQYRTASKKAKLIAPLPAQRFAPKSESMIGTKPLPPLPSNKQLLDDPVTSISRYDLQTNASDQNRIYLYPDGTIAATSIMSHLDSYSDRGTGYNYFDGTSWGQLPDTRIENERAGWPSYAPFGPTGEIVVTHAETAGLILAKRTVKGTGTWTTSILPGPPSAVDISWPRVVTNGPNHTYIHILCVTYTAYMGMADQLLYYRSLDGGTTWDKNNYIIPGLTSSEYTNFPADIYTWADPHGDTLAFTIGDSWQDQLLMKSTDNGNNWTKTIIYHSPYNLGGNSTSFFYCPDGTSAIALDKSGMAHVLFGLQSDSGSSASSYYRPYTQGLIYWNESMPQLPDDLDPATLFANGNYIGWVKDTNVFYPPSGVTLAAYYSSLTSNPQLVIDNQGKIFALWAGATLLVDANNFTLRHLFGRDGSLNPDGTVTWQNDTLVDLTGDWIQYNFSECMYPSASPTSDSKVYILFQKDDYGGAYMKGYNVSGYEGQTTPDDNSFVAINWVKPISPQGVSEKNEQPAFSVGQNFPNPVTGLTRVNVFMQKGGNLSLKITNITGQTLMTLDKANVLPGVSQFNIDASKLTAGVYFYTVKLGDKEITKKMIVQ